MPIGKQKELTVYRWEKDVCHPISMENKRNFDGKKNLSMVNNFDGTSVNGKQMNSDGKNPVSMAFSGLVRAVFHTEPCLSLKDGEFLIIYPSILKIVGCQGLET